MLHIKTFDFGTTHAELTVQLERWCKDNRRKFRSAGDLIWMPGNSDTQNEWLRAFMAAWNDACRRLRAERDFRQHFSGGARRRGYATASNHAARAISAAEGI